MFIQIEAKDIEITPESQKYIHQRVFTLLKPYVSDVKALKVHLSRVRDVYKENIRCILVLKQANNKKKYAEFSSREVTISLESAINQLRIDLFDKTKKLRALQSHVRLLKENRNNSNAKLYQEFNQQLIGV